ncbi:hypothetical protein N657DRAFT_645620, partial [Parathielavia appendiculata]
MPSATNPNPTSTSSVLPPLTARQAVSTKLTALTDAIAAHPQMQPPNRHPTLFHIWDFAMRTNYILSELDNIEAGRAVQHPEQISGLGSSNGTPSPARAKELLTDVRSRCFM